MTHYHHSSTATSNAWIAGMVTLASVAVYWYMSTTEEQRAEQREQVKDKASNAAKQVAGNCTFPKCLLCVSFLAATVAY